MEFMGRKRKSAAIFPFAPCTREPVRRLSVTIHLKGTEYYVPVVLHVYYAVQRELQENLEKDALF